MGSPPATSLLELGVLPRETDCVGQNNLLESGPVAEGGEEQLSGSV